MPREEGVEETHEEKHCELTAECRESGWRERLFPVEMGTGGFVGSSNCSPTGRTGAEGQEAALCHQRVVRGRGEGKLLALVEKREQNMGTSNS